MRAGIKILALLLAAALAVTLVACGKDRNLTDDEKEQLIALLEKLTA